MTDERQIARELVSYYEGEIADRAMRPLGDHRLRRVQAFTELLRASAAQTVLEVGCGAGRDGVIIASSGARYLGVDLTPAAVAACRALGLEAREGSATSLPLEDDSVDAAWSMSTLMHLTDDQLRLALGELARVVRRGGIVEIGVWGAVDPLASTVDGRYFNRRTDDDLRTRLASLGEVVVFDTWDWHPTGYHYQWARIRVA